MENVELSPTIGALAQCRQTVLRRANELIGGAPKHSPIGAAAAETVDGIPGVAGLLMASLEELKVAEEELREQNSALVSARTHEDRELHHYRQLFSYAPAAAVITDRYGAIIETNRSASMLFRRDAEHLAGKPLSALLETTQRDRFRKQLSRVGADSPITDWCLEFHRVGDLPVEVRASVAFVPGVGATGTGVLYWMLRPANAG